MKAKKSKKSRKCSFVRWQVFNNQLLICTKTRNTDICLEFLEGKSKSCCQFYKSMKWMQKTRYFEYNKRIFSRVKKHGRQKRKVQKKHTKIRKHDVFGQRVGRKVKAKKVKSYSRHIHSRERRKHHGRRKHRRGRKSRHYGTSVQIHKGIEKEFHAPDPAKFYRKSPLYMDGDSDDQDFGYGHNSTSHTH
jgi:hypothetical protein